MTVAKTMGAATVSMEVLAFWTDPEAMLVLVGGDMLGSVKLVSKVFSIVWKNELTCGSTVRAGTSALRGSAGLRRIDRGRRVGSWRRAALRRLVGLGRRARLCSRTALRRSTTLGRHVARRGRVGSSGST
jgi:hypothetical protein